LGASTSTPYQGFTLSPLGVFWLCRIFSPSIILKSPQVSKFVVKTLSCGSNEGPVKLSFTV
jgi:hypothetical protein